MITAIPLSSRQVSEIFSEFEGKDHGSETSFILINGCDVKGPALHQHPYSETFVVLEGTARFQVGVEVRIVSKGSAVVVPPNTPHRFESVGPDNLVQIDIHASDRFVTERL